MASRIVRTAKKNRTARLITAEKTNLLVLTIHASDSVTSAMANVTVLEVKTNLIARCKKSATLPVDANTLASSYPMVIQIIGKLLNDFFLSLKSNSF